MRSLKRYLITIGVGLLATLWIVWMKDIFSATEAVKVFHILTDAFFAVGVVITGFGLLIFTSNEGVFDGLVYGVSSFLSMFKKDQKRKYATLYDYKVSREGKRVSGFGFMLICGLFFLAISMVMFALYCKFQ
jgi:hypothetical protein